MDKGSKDIIDAIDVIIKAAKTFSLALEYQNNRLKGLREKIMEKCPICCSYEDEFGECECGYLKIVNENKTYQEAKRIVQEQRKKKKAANGKA